MLIEKIQIFYFILIKIKILFMSILIAVDTSLGKHLKISKKWIHHDHFNIPWLWGVTGYLDKTNNLHHAFKKPVLPMDYQLESNGHSGPEKR